MASVTGCGVMPSRTMRTMYAFCRGETRHAMTMAQGFATSFKKTLCRPLFFWMSSRAGPVTSKAAFVPASTACLISSFTLWRSSPTWLGDSSRLSSTLIHMSSVNTRELKPMLRAVSSLSPVRTQSLMSALRMSSMVSGTLSCSLSSMAVTPTTSISVSISTATFVRAPSRSSISRCAASYFFCHFSAYTVLSCLRATTKVLKPSLANSVRFFTTASWFLGSAALSSITLSAPLHRSRYLPSIFTTTDMRFLVESNWFTARTSYSCPFPSTLTVIRVPTRPLNSN
mmetsp:Transcript_59048/g.189909  ORF Transcript_59048/g.189909 Transcript_59048/m.189909 type:complete len:285 (-) Transcript_59048:1059-1913(-)